MFSDYNDYLTPYEVAYEFDLSLTTIYKLLKNKQLPGFKVGRVWKIPKEDLEKLFHG